MVGTTKVVKKTVKKVNKSTKKPCGTEVGGNTNTPTSNCGSKNENSDNRGSFCKNWCFTVYPFEDLGSKDANLKMFEQIDVKDLNLSWLKINDDIRYFIYQYEMCPDTNRIHVQGYVQFRIRKRLNWIKKHLHDTAHFEAAKGDLKSNQDYCSKSDSKLYGPIQEGLSMKTGERVDIEEIANQILEGHEIDNDMMNNKCYIQHYKYFNNLKNVRKEKLAKESFIEKMKDFEPTKTQKIVYDLLMKQTNRQVLWIHDELGNRGKSSLADYILAKEYDNTFITSNMKHADLMHMYKDQKIILFDYTRAQEEQINYSSIEQFKSGRIFRTKYESSSIISKDLFRICIFANFGPDKSKLSSDRWQILHINKKDQCKIIEEQLENKGVRDTLFWGDEYTFNKMKSMGIDHYFERDYTNYEEEGEYEEESDEEYDSVPIFESGKFKKDVRVKLI
ncbi:Rep [uncultured virus]|uniref:Rep n=1 Tax=uncultured virus TaxID=340016 RepID=A0A2K9LSN2_9VIRU|nr:Rep [uncultured virus]